MKKPITNAYTGFTHHDKFTGTKDELLFYRVMPTGRDVTDKLFFDYSGEFEKYQEKYHPGEEYFLLQGIKSDAKVQTLQEKGDLSN
jgi:hypothetical protein